MPLPPRREPRTTFAPPAVSNAPLAAPARHAPDRGLRGGARDGAVQPPIRIAKYDIRADSSSA